MPPITATPATASRSDLDPNAIAYALAKQVPEITRRGCTIGTAYGEITIPVGYLATRMGAFLAALLIYESNAQAAVPFGVKGGAL